MRRRRLLKLAAAATAAGPLAAFSPRAHAAARARIVVIGGGFGGSTAARYLRLWNPAIEVTLVERADEFTSCPMSNLVLADFARMDDIRRSYDGLKRHGVQVVNDEVASIDADKRRVRLGRGGDLRYDRLVVSPGVDFLFGEIEGYQAAMSAGRVLHAWKAGSQTVELRRQLEQMRDGGVFAISIPMTPFRCPPGPYERASLVADYCKRAKPRAKVLILDANPDVASKPALFKAAWKDYYSSILEYRPNSTAIGVDPATMTLRLEVEDVKADVLNVIPPQRAGDITRQAGLIADGLRWCEVDWRTMESKALPGVHVLGDATLAAPAMPKSASMANSHGKIAAASIIELLSGRPPAPMQALSTCYSFVSRTEAVHIASVHAWDEMERTLKIVPGSGGVSRARSEAEAAFAWNWARTIWADSLD